MQAVQQPEQVAQEEQPERLREGVSPVGQACEEHEAQGKDGGPHELEDQPPTKRFAHASLSLTHVKERSISFSAAWPPPLPGGSLALCEVAMRSTGRARPRTPPHR